MAVDKALAATRLQHLERMRQNVSFAHGIGEYMTWHEPPAHEKRYYAPGWAGMQLETTAEWWNIRERQRKAKDALEEANNGDRDSSSPETVSPGGAREVGNGHSDRKENGHYRSSSSEHITPPSGDKRKRSDDASSGQFLKNKLGTDIMDIIAGVNATSTTRKRKPDEGEFSEKESTKKQKAASTKGSSALGRVDKSLKGDSTEHPKSRVVTLHEQINLIKNLPRALSPTVPEISSQVQVPDLRVSEFDAHTNGSTDSHAVVRLKVGKSTSTHRHDNSTTPRNGLKRWAGDKSSSSSSGSSSSGSGSSSSSSSSSGSSSSDSESGESDDDKNLNERIVKAKKAATTVTVNDGSKQSSGGSKLATSTNSKAIAKVTFTVNGKAVKPRSFSYELRLPLPANSTQKASDKSSRDSETHPTTNKSSSKNAGKVRPSNHQNAKAEGIRPRGREREGSTDQGRNDSSKGAKANAHHESGPVDDIAPSGKQLHSNTPSSANKSTSLLDSAGLTPPVISTSTNSIAATREKSNLHTSHTSDEKNDEPRNTRRSRSRDRRMKVVDQTLGNVVRAWTEGRGGTVEIALAHRPEAVVQGHGHVRDRVREGETIREIAEIEADRTARLSEETERAWIETVSDIAIGEVAPANETLGDPVVMITTADRGREVRGDGRSNDRKDNRRDDVHKTDTEARRDAAEADQTAHTLDPSTPPNREGSKDAASVATPVKRTKVSLEELRRQRTNNPTRSEGAGSTRRNTEGSDTSNEKTPKDGESLGESPEAVDLRRRSSQKDLQTASKSVISSSRQKELGVKYKRLADRTQQTSGQKTLASLQYSASSFHYIQGFYNRFNQDHLQANTMNAWDELMNLLDFVAHYHKTQEQWEWYGLSTKVACIVYRHVIHMKASIARRETQQYLKQFAKESAPASSESSTLLDKVRHLEKFLEEEETIKKRWAEGEKYLSTQTMRTAFPETWQKCRDIAAGTLPSDEQDPVAPIAEWPIDLQTPLLSLVVLGRNCIQEFAKQKGLTWVELD
ncbi:hypothetical protein BZG36_02156 [Bifiguratus adelaidae]|uniref:Uncharacterized protein n=1 Tax=Bifiguratus adelaidae TaxID=1938954 RepID=A0A261Y313_9FUNG|nr:hypothetical protein BZG36_02156 [Bifiguratus adelaidae]